jgi:hypothetical protein
MQKQINDSNIHLYLGLTRTELKKRLSLGLVDPHLLKQQLNDYSEDIKLDALCEQWIEQNAADQVSRDQVQNSSNERD